MTEEAWNEWIESPVTEYFRKYLMDSRKEAAELAAEDIAFGSTVSVEEQIRVATLCLTLHETATLEFAVIEGFYEDQRERKKDASTR